MSGFQQIHATTMNLQCGSSDPPRARLSSAVFGIATTRKVNRHSPTRTSPCDLHRRYPNRYLRIHCRVLAAHTVTLSTYYKIYHSNCDNRRRSSHHRLPSPPPHHISASLLHPTNNNKVCPFPPLQHELSCTTPHSSRCIMPLPQ